ncbi:MAG: copper amine oxidase N-terminal domain-containing protein [Gudongella sp.]|nr:copper amine oxidase N-terminal domain-containing protein [Gudongella sp.]
MKAMNLSLKSTSLVLSVVLVLSFLLVAPVSYGASEGYWKLDNTSIDSKDFSDSSGRLNAVYEIKHGGPEDGFDAVVQLGTTESFGNGVYKAGLKWAHLPAILVPGEKYTLELQLAQIKSTTKLMIGAGASMSHGIESVPPPPGKSGGPLKISVQTFSIEGKEYSQQSLIYQPFPKQADTSLPYIVQIKFVSDSTKDYYNFNYVYTWVDGPVPVSGDIKIILDDQPLVTDVSPIIVNGRTLLPLRSILEALGATVEWDSTTRTVTATKDSTTIQLVIDSSTAIVNGTPQTLDVPAQIKNGRTLVPLRFLAETFGATVLWDGVTRTITIY